MSFLKKQARLVSGNLLNMVLAAVLSIYLARLLGPEKRGLLALYNGLGTTLATLFCMGLPASCAYFCRAIPGARAGLAKKTLLATAGVGLFAAVTLLLFRGALSGLFLDGYPLTDFWVVLIALQSAIMAGALASGAISIALGDAHAAATYSNIGSAIGFCVTFAAATALPWKVEAGFIGFLIGPLIAFSLQIRRLLQQVADSSPATRDPSWAEIFAFGGKTQIGSIAAIVFKRFDVFVVSHFAGLAAVGFYTVGLSLRDMALTVPRAAAGLLGGEMADPKNADRKTFLQLLKRNLALNIGICAVMVAVAWPVFPIAIPLLFGKAFHASITPAFVLMAGIIFLTPAMLLSASTKALGAPFTDSMALVAASLPSLGGMYLLTERFSLHGAAWASALASLILMVCSAIAFLIQFRSRYPARPTSPS